MATDTGKTRTAIALMFRLIQSQRFKRVCSGRSSLARAAGAGEGTLKTRALTVIPLTAFLISKFDR